VHMQWTGPGTEPKLTLYVLAIGISNYKDRKVDLHFAAKDAADFVSLAKAQAGGLYEKVILPPSQRACGTLMPHGMRSSTGLTGSYTPLPTPTMLPWSSSPVTG